jgi:hypothetical protein
MLSLSSTMHPIISGSNFHKNIHFSPNVVNIDSSFEVPQIEGISFGFFWFLLVSSSGINWMFPSPISLQHLLALRTQRRLSFDAA